MPYKWLFFRDHEEIGSNTIDGAASPALSDILKRISLGISLPEEEMIRLKTHSLCFSVDVAHAFNPNFPAKYDPEHKCLLGKGLSLKYNANRKYATDAKTAAIILQACNQEQIPCQSFTSHSNISSGSTVGPIVAQNLGIPTADIGCPILSMHSAREVMATQDHL
jgi:aspartyl aminopeptidase